MAIDPSQIELSLEQKQRLAEMAEDSGKDYRVVLDDLLALRDHDQQEAENGTANKPKTLYEALDAIGAIGCFEGPGDLSTNPKYMEGFGINASRKQNSD